MARPEAKLRSLPPAEPALDLDARRELVVTLGRRAAPRIIPCGDELACEGLPAGTRVIYSPPPFDPLPAPAAAIRYALLRPLNAEPLFAQLRPELRVTIAVDDFALPTRQPDVRARILEQVLQTLADYGVDDVQIVVATGLNRHLTASEIQRIVGARVYRQFWPDRLVNFDAEDAAELTLIGHSTAGEEVWFCRRAAETDLLILVNLQREANGAGQLPLGAGLMPYRSLRHCLTPAIAGLASAASNYRRGALPEAASRISQVVNQAVNCFAISATVDGRAYGGMLDFLQKNEDRFDDWDRLRLDGLRWTLQNLSPAARRRLLQRYPLPWGMTGVWAGAPAAVHQQARARLLQQHLVPVTGQTDILIVGMPFQCPDSVNSIMNPVLVRHAAFAAAASAQGRRPLLREGGTLIVCHPLRDEFQPEHHPSYVEFFHRCLTTTTDAAALAQRFEPAFAHNPNYLHMYRYGQAYHGVHPLFAWYAGAAASRNVGRVIAARCEEPAIAARLGWEAAGTLDEAIAMAAADLGRGASITYLHGPSSSLVAIE